MAVNWAFRMLLHPSEAYELQTGLDAIKPVMLDAQSSRGEKRRMLNVMVTELSEKTFSLNPVIEQIMEIINMKEEVCWEYDNTESQVDGILSWLPRMSQHRDMLAKRVKQHRLEFGLKV